MTEHKAKPPAPAVDGWFDRHQMKLLKGSLVTLFVLMVLGGVYISYEMLTLSQQAHDNARAVTLLSKNLDTSRKQLTDHGIIPSAPSSKTVIEQVPGAQGAPGAAGAPGKNGEPGVSGPSGSPGPTGKAGQGGAPGAAGSPGPTGAPGVNGSDGAPGKDGAPGPAGQDGKDGAPGAQGPAGPVGPAGVAGQDGKDGKDGRDGAPPASWTWTDPQGVSYTCTEDSGTDPAAPHYTCKADPAPPVTSPPASAGFLASGIPGGPSPRPGMPLMMSVGYAIISDRKRL
jgi:hypothetical protein